MSHGAEISRRRFLHTLLASAALAPGLAALGGGFDRLRGDRVGWARLKTSSPIWQRHARSDPKLMQFFREHTTLNIDPIWYAADVENLAEMCKYPFLFSQDIRPAQGGNARNNLTEYIRRGGFLFMDSCINPGSRGNAEVFITQHAGAFTKLLPETRVTVLPADHELFRCCFNFPDGPPHTAIEPGWDNHPFYAVHIGRRMVGLISTSGLQCGWDNMKQERGHDVVCMKMLVNIYIYAMMQGA
jgi:hypothetical protein